MVEQKCLLAHSPSFSDDVASTVDHFPVSSPDYAFSFSINTPALADDLADSIFSNGWILPSYPNSKSGRVPEPVYLRSASVSSSDETELELPRTLKKSKIRDLIFGRRSLSVGKGQLGNLSLKKGGNGKEMDMSSLLRLFYGKEKGERRRSLSVGNRQFENLSLKKGGNGKELDMSSVHRLFYGKEKGERGRSLSVGKGQFGNLSLKNRGNGKEMDMSSLFRLFYGKKKGERRRSLSVGNGQFENLSLKKGENGKELDMSSVHRLFYGKEKGERERRTFLPYRQDLLGGLFGK